jgi:hypothetical protein
MNTNQKQHQLKRKNKNIILTIMMGFLLKTHFLLMLFSNAIFYIKINSTSIHYTQFLQPTLIAPTFILSSLSLKTNERGK